MESVDGFLIDFWGSFFISSFFCVNQSIIATDLIESRWSAETARASEKETKSKSFLLHAWSIFGLSHSWIHKNRRKESENRAQKKSKERGRNEMLIAFPSTCNTSRVDGIMHYRSAIA